MILKVDGIFSSFKIRAFLGDTFRYLKFSLYFNFLDNVAWLTFFPIFKKNFPDDFLMVKEFLLVFNNIQLLKIYITLLW